MAGYADRDGPSAGAADPLEANLLLLESQGAHLLWVTLDSLAVTAHLRGRILQSLPQRFTPHHVLITASHTHSAPVGWVGEVHPVLPAEVDEGLCTKLAETIGAAAAKLTPAPVRLSSARVQVQGVGSNRHRRDGPHDPSADVLLVEGDDGPLAALYDYACHPTVLGPDNCLWSADFVGAARERIRQAVGPDVPVLFLQGAAGDVSCRFHRRSQDLGEVARLGGLLGDRIVDGLTATRHTQPGPLTVTRLDVVLPTRTDFGTTASHAPDDPRVQASLAEGLAAAQAQAASPPPPTMHLPVTVVTLGDKRWLTTPLELCAALGRAITAGQDVRVIGYTDDYAGYLADAEAHRLGHYEALSSRFDQAASEQFVRACRELLAQPER